MICSLCSQPIMDGQSYWNHYVTPQLGTADDAMFQTHVGCSIANEGLRSGGVFPDFWDYTAKNHILEEYVQKWAEFERHEIFITGVASVGTRVGTRRNPWGAEEIYVGETTWDLRPVRKS